MLIPSIHERKSWLAGLLIALVGLNLYFNFSFEGRLEGRVRYLDEVFGRVLLPVQWVISGTRDLLSNSSENLVELVTAKRRNIELETKWINARLQLLNFEDLKQENARLREMLGFRENLNRDYLAARVVAKDPSLFFQSLVINRGSNDGVKKDDAVINIDGVVGRVLEVDSTRSRVLLVTDYHSRVDAVVLRSRSRAIASGASEGNLRLQYLPKRQDIRVGDQLLSSGLAGIFPSGLPIGKVEQMSTDPNRVLAEAVVSPAVDINSVEEVFVIVGGSQSPSSNADAEE